jgi:oxygen-independent coproporphyrinogen-3 oxidase
MLTSYSSELQAQLAAHAYPGYVYGYPHKKAYRRLAEPVRLAEVWAEEKRTHLFAYVHIPFCHQRCSFCNLFTLVPGDRSGVGPYLDALARQMATYAKQVPAHYARLYIGGGTPTYLSSIEIRRLVADLRAILGIDPSTTQACIETSPETLDAQKIDTLRELGFRRISLGVQSLVEDELHAVNRRFDFSRHADAIRLIGQAGFPEFNLDLIYGLPGQSLTSWCHSLQQAIDSPATSLFLYPLYVRPLTGLGRRTTLDAPSTCQMGTMYDAAVDRLSNAGFRQITMRQFRRDALPCRDDEGYRCERDGMVGLGAGARSYTTHLHYSTPWKMIARNIRHEIEEFITADPQWIRHGIWLDEDERQRRWVIQGLLYQGVEACAESLFPDEFTALAQEGLVHRKSERLCLTPRGVRHADIVGNLFFSARVRALMDSFEYDV